MKKIYLSLALVGFATTSLFAQQTASNFAELGPVIKKQNIGEKPVTNQATTKSLLWNEDFANGLNSTNGMWTQGGADQIWKHSMYPSSGEWSTGTNAMASTTAANGYMLFDADSVNFPISPNYLPLTGELISPVIDLSGAPSVMMSFEQDSRFCCSGTHDLTVSVSTDGGGSWGTPYVVNTGQAANGDFFALNGNDYVTTVNISAEAAGQANVKIKFTWDGNLSASSHYYWTIDDVCLLDLPGDDLQTWASWISGENNEGNEYGRTPEDHQDGNYLVGSQIYNFGANDQTNLIWGADFGGGLLATATHPLLVSGDTVMLETTEAWGPLAIGMYTGDYGVISDGETQASPDFANNIGLREFEITPPSTAANSVYSLDGIDVYTNPSLSSLGTDSFTGGEDGLVVATMYYIKQAADVSGIRVMLATGTVAGAEVYGSLKDTATVFNDDMTALFNTNAGTVTAADISNGYIDLMFAAPVNLATGAYFAAAELYSNGNSTDIRVLDDETIDQPFWSSVIYIPGDQVYTNGVALGVRVLMGSSWATADTDGDGVTDATEGVDGTDANDMCSFILSSVTEVPSAAWLAADCDNDGVSNGDEVIAGTDPLIGLAEQTLTGVSIYPNPSEGVFNITNDNGVAYTISVHNLAGKLILTTEASAATTIDLSENGTGVYLVEVSNGAAKFVERVIVK
ncbi:MAG: T9SS type A sorting domain-containing protein [Crocinitomicaceae bacterium]|nr:T9SS type A sorting domain-containing protein [Crocinitomicaceae bacterium]